MGVHWRSSNIALHQAVGPFSSRYLNALLLACVSGVGAGEISSEGEQKCAATPYARSSLKVSAQPLTTLEPPALFFFGVQ